MFALIFETSLFLIMAGSFMVQIALELNPRNRLACSLTELCIFIVSALHLTKRGFSRRARRSIRYRTVFRKELREGISSFANLFNAEELTDLIRDTTVFVAHSAFLVAYCALSITDGFDQVSSSQVPPQVNVFFVLFNIATLALIAKSIQPFYQRIQLALDQVGINTIIRLSHQKPKRRPTTINIGSINILYVEAPNPSDR